MDPKQCVIKGLQCISNMRGGGGVPVAGYWVFLLLGFVADFFQEKKQTFPPWTFGMCCRFSLTLIRYLQQERCEAVLFWQDKVFPVLHH